MPKYDVLIKAHQKDYTKLKHVVESVKFLHPQPEGVYIVSPDGYIPENGTYKITAVKDEEVFPFMDRSKIKFRPNWFYAMFVGMFQNITPNEYYLDMQSDNFFVRDIDLFENDKPIFFISPQRPQYHYPYFGFNKKVFNLPDRHPLCAPMGFSKTDSFVIEFMMYNKSVSKEMIDMYGGIENLFNKCCETQTEHCHMGDYELYPSWCLVHHPGLYVIKNNIQTRVTGKDYPDDFTDEQIMEVINASKAVDDVIVTACHTWRA